jgi:hypothetical protein
MKLFGGIRYMAFRISCFGCLYEYKARSSDESYNLIGIMELYNVSRLLMPAEVCVRFS